MKLTRSVLPTLIVCILLLTVQPVLGWSNGGYSADPSSPDYGTHDWIAQHALDYLPAQEKQYIVDNLAVYLYGTELPDNNQASDGIGDTGKHHSYFYANGTLQDDSSAKRANEEYQKALTYLKNKDYTDAAKEAGVMTHYIADMAVFGHMMGTKTAWGTEKHHSDYETYVTDKTEAYDSTFNSYLTFDGSLRNVSAYDAAKNVAYDTTFGGGSSYGCGWMDSSYDWSNTAFSSRSGQSLNLAVNAVADVLHTLYLEANPGASPMPSATPMQSPSPTPTAPEYPTLQALTVAMLTILAAALIYRKTRKNQ